MRAVLLGNRACAVQDLVYTATPTRERLYADLRLVSARSGLSFTLEQVESLLDDSGGRVVRGTQGSTPGVQVVDGRVVVLGDVVGLVSLNGGDESVKKGLGEARRMGDWVVLVLDGREQARGMHDGVGAQGRLLIHSSAQAASQRGAATPTLTPGTEADDPMPPEQATQRQEVSASASTQPSQTSSVHGSQAGDAPPASGHGTQAGDASAHTPQLNQVPSVHGSATGSQGRRGVPLLNVPTRNDAADNGDVPASIRGSNTAGAPPASPLAGAASVYGIRTPPASVPGSEGGNAMKEGDQG